MSSVRPSLPTTLSDTVALVMVELGRKSWGRDPSPVPRMSSGNTCTSIAFWLPSGPGTVVVPMKEPTLMSASEILMMPTIFASVVRCSLTPSPLRDFTASTSPSTPSMVPRTRVGVGDCCAIAPNVDAAIMASTISGRLRVERRVDMGESPVGGSDLMTDPDSGMKFRFTRTRPAASMCSCTREIGLHQRTKLGCHLRSSPEPQFEAAHRLMQQHAEPVGSLQSARFRRHEQRRLERHIDEIGDQSIIRQFADIEIERLLTVHAERGGVDQKFCARQE